MMTNGVDRVFLSDFISGTRFVPKVVCEYKQRLKPNLDWS